MWVVVILACQSMMATSCNVGLYNKKFFEDLEVCAVESRAIQSSLAENGIASATYCFDITVIGNKEPVEPDL